VAAVIFYIVVIQPAPCLIVLEFSWPALHCTALGWAGEGRGGEVGPTQSEGWLNLIYNKRQVYVYIESLIDIAPAEDMSFHLPLSQEVV